MDAVALRRRLSTPVSGDAMKTTSAANGSKTNGNGKKNGAGNGHSRVRPKEAARREVLSGQPSVESLLGVARSDGQPNLDKSQLLAALLAFKKGDFTVRLPLH